MLMMSCTSRDRKGLSDYFFLFYFHLKTKKHEHWNSLVVSNQELVCQEFEEESKGEDDCRDKKQINRKNKK